MIKLLIVIFCETFGYYKYLRKKYGYCYVEFNMYKDNNFHDCHIVRLKKDKNNIYYFNIWSKYGRWIVDVLPDRIRLSDGGDRVLNAKWVTKPPENYFLPEQYKKFYEYMDENKYFYGFHGSYFFK
jgi:hypothetical protein